MLNALIENVSLALKCSFIKIWPPRKRKTHGEQLRDVIFNASRLFSNFWRQFQYEMFERRMIQMMEMKPNERIKQREKNDFERIRSSNTNETYLNRHSLCAMKTRQNVYLFCRRCEVFGYRGSDIFVYYWHTQHWVFSYFQGFSSFSFFVFLCSCVSILF